MKRILIMSLLLAACHVLCAQAISVKSFTFLGDDHTAISAEGKHIDAQGKPDALIKVITNESGFIFDGGAYGIRPFKSMEGELWVWVPESLSTLSILHPQLGALREYRIPIPLESGRVYRMELIFNKDAKDTVSSDQEAVEVTIKVDADAEIWVNDKQVGVRSWTGKLSKDTYQLSCRQASHEPTVTTQKIDGSMNGKTIFLLPPRPIYTSMSVESNPNGAAIIIDGKPMGETPKFFPEILIGEHVLRLVKEGYEPEEKTIMAIKDDRMKVEVTLQKAGESASSNANGTVTKPKSNKSSRRHDPAFFATLNGAVGSMPLLSFGFSIGQVKDFGWFVSVMTNGGFKGFSAVGECDANGLLDGGYKPLYSGASAIDRLSVIAGGVMRLTDVIDARLGLGYGVRNLCWETVDGDYYKNQGYSTTGVDASAGVQLHFNQLLFSVEAVTTNFKTIEGKLGVGYVF